MTEDQCYRRFQPRQSLPPPPPDPRGRVEDGRDGRRARREEEEERARREKEEVLRNEEQPVDEEEEEEEEEERYTTVPSRGREEVGGYSVITSMRRGREREEEQDQRRQKEEEEEQEEVEEETYSSSVPTLRRGQMRYHRLHQFSRLPPVPERYVDYLKQAKYPNDGAEAQRFTFQPQAQFGEPRVVASARHRLPHLPDPLTNLAASTGSTSGVLPQIVPPLPTKTREREQGGLAAEEGGGG